MKRSTIIFDFHPSRRSQRRGMEGCALRSILAPRAEYCAAPEINHWSAKKQHTKERETSRRTRSTDRDKRKQATATADREQ